MQWFFMCKGFSGASVSHLSSAPFGVALSRAASGSQMQKGFTCKNVSHAKTIHLNQILHLEKCFTWGAVTFSEIPAS